jgi:hypothetical protein
VLAVELSSGLSAVESPVDFHPAAIGAPVPCPGFSGQTGQVCDPALPQTLAGEQTDLDLRLVQPAAVLRTVNWLGRRFLLHVRLYVQVPLGVKAVSAWASGSQVFSGDLTDSFL